MLWNDDGSVGDRTSARRSARTMRKSRALGGRRVGPRAASHGPHRQPFHAFCGLRASAQRPAKPAYEQGFPADSGSAYVCLKIVVSPVRIRVSPLGNARWTLDALLFGPLSAPADFGTRLGTRCPMQAVSGAKTAVFIRLLETNTTRILVVVSRVRGLVTGAHHRQPQGLRGACAGTSPVPHPRANRPERCRASLSRRGRLHPGGAVRPLARLPLRPDSRSTEAGTR